MQRLQHSIHWEYATKTQSADNPTPEQNLFTRQQQQDVRFVRETLRDTFSKSTNETNRRRGAQTSENINSVARKGNFLQQDLWENHLLFMYEREVGNPQTLTQRPSHYYQQFYEILRRLQTHT